MKIFTSLFGSRQEKLLLALKLLANKCESEEVARRELNDAPENSEISYIWEKRLEEIIVLKLQVDTASLTFVQICNYFNYYYHRYYDKSLAAMLSKKFILGHWKEYAPASPDEAHSIANTGHFIDKEIEKHFIELTQKIAVTKINNCLNSSVARQLYHDYTCRESSGWVYIISDATKVICKKRIAELEEGELDLAINDCNSVNEAIDYSDRCFSAVACKAWRARADVLAREDAENNASTCNNFELALSKYCKRVESDDYKKIWLERINELARIMASSITNRLEARKYYWMSPCNSIARSEFLMRYIELSLHK